MLRFMNHIITPLVVLCALLSACTSQVDDAVADAATEPVLMRVGAQLVSPTVAETTSPPVFLFWEASSILEACDSMFFLAIPDTNSVAAYYPTDLTTLKSDSTTWYDTGHPYLNDDETVLVTGFIPASAAAYTDKTDADGITTREYDYTHIVLPQEMLATDELWITQAALLGSSYNPFSKALSFIHATTRVIFKAQLAEGMSSPLRDVKLTVHPSGSVLYAMKWQSYPAMNRLTQCGFVVDEDYEPSEADQTAAAERLVSKPYTNTLPSANQVAGNSALLPTLATFYLRPGLSGVTIDVTAKMGSSSSNLTDYIVKNLAVTFNQDNTAVTLGSGDSYELILKFSKDAITFSGTIAPFEEAGNYYVALTPFTTTSM
jgi:hypothetical protein